MISPVNGEVCFTDGLWLGAFSKLPDLLGMLVNIAAQRESLPPWPERERLRPLGIHPSNRGEFSVYAILDAARRVKGVYLSHSHPFYEEKTPLDGERRIYHEGVIALELLGQREYPWGQVFCRFNQYLSRDWLVLIYQRDLNVPMHAAEEQRILHEHDPIPRPERSSLK
jgi:hypothetical protein